MRPKPMRRPRVCASTYDTERRRRTGRGCAAASVRWGVVRLILCGGYGGDQIVALLTVAVHEMQQMDALTTHPTRGSNDRWVPRRR